MELEKDDKILIRQKHHTESWFDEHFTLGELFKFFEKLHEEKYPAIKTQPLPPPVAPPLEWEWRVLNHNDEVGCVMDALGRRITIDLSLAMCLRIAREHNMIPPYEKLEKAIREHRLEESVSQHVHSALAAIEARRVEGETK